MKDIIIQNFKSILWITCLASITITTTAIYINSITSNETNENKENKLGVCNDQLCKELHP